MATPAAVLSILVKAQGVQATSTQLRGLDKSARTAGTGMATTEKHAKRTSRTFGALGSAAKTAGPLIGAVGLAAGLKTAVSEFREAQKTGAQTTAVLKSTGNSAKVTKKHIEDLAGSISKKSGIDDEAIQSGANLLLTFTKVRNETGKGNKIFDQATQTITDMSVALGQSGKSSAIQLGKALNDPIKGITALRRVGVSFTADQEKQIKAMVTSGDLLGAQKRILKELRTEFGGSAAAQATAGDKLKVSLGNLAEVAGSYLVPQLDKLAAWLTKVINQFVRGEGIARVIIPVFWNLVGAIRGVVQTISGLVQGFKDGNTGAVLLGIALAALTAGFLAYKTLVIATSVALRVMAAAQVLLNVAMYANPIGLVVIGLAALSAALVVAYMKFETFRKIVDSTFNWIKSNWPLVLGILTGPIGLAVLAIVKNWGAIKRAFSDGVQAILGTLRGSVGAIAGAGRAMGTALINAFKAALNFAHELAVAMRDLISKAPGYALGVGQAIVRGIVNGIKSVGEKIGDALKGILGGVGGALAGAAGKIGDGIGKAAAPSMKAPGSLMGARAVMAPFAAVGAANGLRVSSGLRAGARTSSGNVSWHSTGEAVDLAGPPGGMLKTFRTLKSAFGSRLAELIYTPGGVGIKDGRPHTYTGKVAADHFDHVHVAFDSGAAGQGDGIGKRVRAAFIGDGYGKSALQSLWRKAGGPASAANIAAAVALAESGGNSRAMNRNTDGSIDRGLWQINSIHGSKSTFNPLGNAKSAVSISGRGRNWSPWVAFTNGAYKKFLGAASKGGAAVKRKKGGGISGGTKPAFGGGPAGMPEPGEGMVAVPTGGGGFKYMQQSEVDAQAAHNQSIFDSLAEEEAQRRQQAEEAATAAAEALAEQLQRTNALLTEQRDELRRTLNTSQSQYAVLAKAIADVASGQIGGRAGLGFMSPSFPGGVSRY